MDTKAFFRAATVLNGGGCIIIAPEGTRSHHGRLQKASAGVVTLAFRTGAPILPIGHWGGERVLPSLARLRRAIVRVRVGELYRLRGSAGATRGVRDRELDRAMDKLARLLPQRYRGYYG